MSEINLNGYLLFDYMKNESVFLEVFGNNPVMKVIDFLITYQLFDYHLTEIAKDSGVSCSTMQVFWDKLERNKIVIKTRRIGKSDLFKLNIENPTVKELIKLDWNLIKGSEMEIVI
ncbi:hypothetical protein HYT56_04730 [Candidatus Woesearchaeota archaeon]|nr:hypothetical protein [Candidatus Woesearchaeota archaeon]